MYRIPLILVVELGLAASAVAEPSLGDLTDAAEIERDPLELEALLADPVDPDFLDTVLVFHNSSTTTALVGCAAVSANGRGLGRGYVKIPGNGVRHLLASDLSNDVDFVGSAACRFRGGRVIPSAFVVAPAGITDAKTAARGTRIKFPIVAHR